MKTEENKRIQLNLDMTDEEVKAKQLYLYYKSEKVADYILSKPKDANNVVVLEPNELEKRGVTTNGYGIKVFFNHDFGNKQIYGCTNPQIVTGGINAFVVLSKKLNEKNIKFSLQHEIIHALDFIGYYSTENKNDRSNVIEETPESIGEKYGFNSNPKYPSNIDSATREVLIDVFYKSDPFEFYSLMANVKDHITKKYPYLIKEEMKKLIIKDLIPDCKAKIDIVAKYDQAMQSDRLPKREEDLENNLTGLVMYCTLLNKSIPSFLFPNFIPEKFDTSDSLFSMDEETFHKIQEKTYSYLSRATRLFNEMVDLIIDDCINKA